MKDFVAVMSFENKFASVEQYLRKLSGQEKEPILVDHNYVKAWNAHPDSHRTKPARMLFMKGLQRYPHLSNNRNHDTEIDIETYEESVSSPFDNQKTKLLASECERSLKYNPLFGENDGKEDDFDLSSCTPRQARLYQQVLNLLNTHRLAKLAFCGTPNESIKKRLATDKAGGQLRKMFGTVFWDIKLLTWLHKTVMSRSDIGTLSTYLDVLQTLRAKVPNLVERMLQSHAGSSTADAVAQILKRQWDPVLPILNQHKPKKLPGNPIILITPSAPNQQMINSQSQRLRFWHNNLSSLCKVMNVPVCAVDGKKPLTVESCLDNIITSVRNKVTELKNHYPNRPVILLGWTIGALIACHVALQEPVAAVVCLGFPLTGVNGSRGDLNDPLLDSKVPTLFIVGQNARMCSTDDVEDFRSRMRAETGLVVIGGADDFLRMSPMKMSLECATQSMVDRCLLDEVSDFLLSVFVKLPSTSSSNPLVAPKTCSPIKEDDQEVRYTEEEGKRRRRKPREYSPELSPVRKRPKHHIPRQSTPITPKARLSPSSSETSSSGSFINEKPGTSKTVKKLTEKRPGRPAAGNWRKRLTTKSVSDIRREEYALRKVCRTGTEREKSTSPVKASPRSETKSSLPFPVNILPKKNDPVDVEKAFGRDSSFLPRPLTPPEPEDTVSAEETEKAMAELDAMAELEAISDKPLPEPPLAKSSAVGTSLLNQVISSTERSFLPISDKSSDSLILTSKAISSTSVKPTVVSTAESKTTVVTVTPGLRTVFPQGKVIASGSLQTTLKNISGVNLIGSNQTGSAASISPTKSTIITVPSSSTATILVTSPAIRTQPTKMIQLLSKGTSAVAAKSPGTATAGSSTPSETPEQPVCNLSLLSDVAGMTEPLKDTSKKAEAAASSATLVKLAVPDKSHPQAIKCLKVIKTVRAPSPPARFETPEELVEKQLAIQALNNSIGIDSPSTLKEPGYSICYAKPDGSIISRAVAVTRPGFPSYLSRMPAISSHSRGRGRVRPAFSSKPFKFYDV